MPYLSASGIRSRLYYRFGIEAEITDGDAEMASSELDSLGPFIGYKRVTDGTQPEAFPRSIKPDGTANEDIDLPAAVLDWVALCAYRIGTDDAPALTSQSRSGLSESYATPYSSKTERRMAGLVAPYLLRMGRSVSDRYPVSSSGAYYDANW